MSYPPTDSCENPNDLAWLEWLVVVSVTRRVGFFPVVGLNSAALPSRLVTCKNRFCFYAETVSTTNTIQFCPERLRKLYNGHTTKEFLQQKTSVGEGQKKYLAGI